MAGNIAYSFDPGQVIWVIDETVCTSGLTVLQGTVVRVRGELLITTSTVNYDIRIGTNAGTKAFVEADIFATLAEAVAEYEIRLS